MFGQGIYTIAEAARFARLKPSTVRGWFRRDDSLLKPSISSDDGKPLISFLDLVDVKVVGQMREGQISMQAIKRFYASVEDKLRVKHPFAHERFYVEGGELFIGLQAGDSEFIASTKTGQTVFVDVVKPFLREIHYSQITHHADLWTIAPGVVLDPKVNFGAPTIQGTRLRTETIRQSFKAEGGDSRAVAVVADWHSIKSDLVKAALRFEGVSLETAA